MNDGIHAILPPINNYYAEKFLSEPIYLMFCRIPKCLGLLESVFRAIVNGLRVYPPGGLARHLCGGLARRFSCPPFLWRSGGLEGLPAMFVAGWPQILCPGGDCGKNKYLRPKFRPASSDHFLVVPSCEGFVSFLSGKV